MTVDEAINLLKGRGYTVFAPGDPCQVGSVISIDLLRLAATEPEERAARDAASVRDMAEAIGVELVLGDHKELVQHRTWQREGREHRLMTFRFYAEKDKL